MAGAILRLFGPESMGGVGYFGARIDAETARTGLSNEEIGQKVYNSILLMRSSCVGGRSLTKMCKMCPRVPYGLTTEPSAMRASGFQDGQRQDGQTEAVLQLR